MSNSTKTKWIHFGGVICAASFAFPLCAFANNAFYLTGDGSESVMMGGRDEASAAFTVIRFSPAIAWKVNDELSLGVGLRRVNRWYQRVDVASWRQVH